MRLDARKAARLAVRSIPSVIGAVAAGIVVAGGFAELAALRLPHGLLLLALASCLALLAWRRARGPRHHARFRRVLLVALSESFVASLPGGKIPDRRDFYALPGAERVRRALAARAPA